jgi:hypothetical protein
MGSRVSIGVKQAPAKQIQEADDVLASQRGKAPVVRSKGLGRVTLQIHLPKADSSLMREIIGAPPRSGKLQAADPDVALEDILTELEDEVSKNPSLMETLDVLQAEFETQPRADFEEPDEPIWNDSSRSMKARTNTPDEAYPLLKSLKFTPTHRDVMRGILKEGIDGFPDPAVVNAAKASIRKLGWSDFNDASLEALLAMDPAKKTARSTAMAVAWHCATVGAYNQAMKGEEVGNSLAGVPNFEVLRAKVKDYLRANCLELLQALDILQVANSFKIPSTPRPATRLPASPRSPRAPVAD